MAVDIDKLIAKAADEHIIVQGREPALKRLFFELSTEEPSVADPTITSADSSPAHIASSIPSETSSVSIPAEPPSDGSSIQPTTESEAK